MMSPPINCRHLAQKWHHGFPIGLFFMRINFSCIPKNVLAKCLRASQPGVKRRCRFILLVKFALRVRRAYFPCDLQSCVPILDLTAGKEIGLVYTWYSSGFCPIASLCSPDAKHPPSHPFTSLWVTQNAAMG